MCPSTQSRGLRLITNVMEVSLPLLISIGDGSTFVSAFDGRVRETIEWNRRQEAMSDNRGHV